MQGESGWIEVAFGLAHTGIPQTVERSDEIEHWSKASSDEVTLSSYCPVTLVSVFDSYNLRLETVVLLD